MVKIKDVKVRIVADDSIIGNLFRKLKGYLMFSRFYNWLYGKPRQQKAEVNLDEFLEHYACGLTADAGPVLKDLEVMPTIKEDSALFSPEKLSHMTKGDVIQLIGSDVMIEITWTEQPVKKQEFKQDPSLEGHRKISD